MDTLLELRDLSVGYKTSRGLARAARHIDLRMQRGEAWALVGESGSGKSTVALAIMGLQDKRHCEVSGEAVFDGQDLLTMSGKELRDLRGRRISMIFQDPMTSLTPYLRIGDQVAEPLRRHMGLSKDEAQQKAIELLADMGIPEPEKRAARYPHEFSGGMRQRAMIAAALACGPDLLVADEPTTALDVTIQEQILLLVKRQLASRGMSLLLITHDLGIVAGMCDHVAVLYGGRVVETGPVADIYASPAHPYTRALLKAVPRADTSSGSILYSLPGQPPRPNDLPPGCVFEPRCAHKKPECAKAEPPLREDSRGICHACLFELPPDAKSAAESATRREIANAAILEIEDLEVRYAAPRGLFSRNSEDDVVAVNGVTFELREGEILGLVGESGCGKTTVLRSIPGLVQPSRGQIRFEGKDILSLSTSERRQTLRQVQLVFQDPYASLNPRMRVGDIVAEPLVNFGLCNWREARSRAAELLEQVGLEPMWVARYPHEFSGGQRQRIGIARALALEPKMLLCDEPVSALDVSIQAQVLNLLRELRDRLSLSMLFVSHDLAVVRQIADRVAIMNEGRIVECDQADRVYESPQDVYTKRLLAAIPAMPHRGRPRQR
jgi:peptide/nickel transport system ATP-binding protein